MARILEHTISAPRTCPYLPGELYALEAKIMVHVNADELEQLLVHGWRRFGPSYFRPVCSRCTGCISLRIAVADFEPSKSQRRAAAAWRAFRVEVSAPRIDHQRLELYHAWHAMREVARGWPPDLIDAESYSMQFCFPHPCSREFAFYDGAKLVGVAISDETRAALSAIYFYYDPAYARCSLGVGNVLFHIDYARTRGRSHIYLGYCVEDCASLRYKRRFRPHEVLVGRPELHEPPQWVRP